MTRLPSILLATLTLSAASLFGQDLRRDADQPTTAPGISREVPQKSEPLAVKRAWLREKMIEEFRGTGREGEIDAAVNKMSAYRINKLLSVHRKRPQVLRQMQVANARAQLAQQQAYRNFMRQQYYNRLAAARYAGYGHGHGYGHGRPIGYAPVIAWLPSGTSLGVSGVVSADRRYVRIGAQPFFSNVTSVNTFNMATGETRNIYRDPRWHR